MTEGMLPPPKFDYRFVLCFALMTNEFAYYKEGDRPGEWAMCATPEDATPFPNPHAAVIKARDTCLPRCLVAVALVGVA